MSYYLNPSELRFFKTGSDQWPILVASEKQGNLFNSSGGHYHAYPDYLYGLEGYKRRGDLGKLKETDLKTILKFIKDSSFAYYKGNKLTFLTYIGWPDITVEVNEQKRKEIVNNLKKFRAFNEDSAVVIKSNERELYDILVFKGYIKQYENRYFFNQNCKPPDDAEESQNDNSNKLDLTQTDFNFKVTTYERV